MTVSKQPLPDPRTSLTDAPASSERDTGAPEYIGLFHTAPSGRPPEFHRAPREYVPPPLQEVEIQAPPPAPQRPATTVAGLITTVLLPIIITLVALGFMMVLLSSASSYLWLSIPFVIISAITGFYSFNHERRKYRELSIRREQIYSEYLQERRQHLEALHEQQRRASLIPYPSLQECQARAERRDRRLWECTPGDQDFLELRLGIGRLPTTFALKPPSSSGIALEPDPLLEQGQALAAEFQMVDGVAITLPLHRVGAAGIAGPRPLVIDTMRTLLVQLAARHAPSEVKIVLITPAAEREAWAWARWLPHVWNDDRSRRYLASDPESARQLLMELRDVLKQRQLQQERLAEQNPSLAVPAYVFVFADPDLLEGPDTARLGLILQFLRNYGRTVGAYSFFTSERPELVRQECGAVVDLTGGTRRLRLVGPPPAEVTFQPDDIAPEAAEQFARILAPLRLRDHTASAVLPPVVPLLDLLGANRVADLNILDNWARSKPFASLAAPIGRRADGEVQYLDLHQEQHGPHGLVAGTVGSGKSELLQSLVASLAVHFHPHEVVFALLDFKGGDMADKVGDLPHVVSRITDLEIDLVPRALISLQAELERRSRIFKEVREKIDPTVTDLDQYMQLYRQGRVSECIPYLVLIVDEFTILKSRRPDDMDKFIAVAILGRSLGFRMILATQRPAGVVSEQIDANTNLRLCLRVARPEDSQEIIKRPDAAFLTGRGKAYVRVGQDMLYELFQVAWSGAPYRPDDPQVRDPLEIALVELDGSRRVLSSAHSQAQTPELGQSHIQVLVRHINEVAARAGLAKLPGVWLPPLPTTVSLEEIRERRTGGWDGQRWHPTERWLTPLIGLVDDPARQHQGPLSIPLGEEGHLAIFGGPGSGKTTLAQTLITSLVLDHSPAEVNLYLLDFGSRLLKVFEPLPHVGAVILPNETERLERLARMLLRELEARKELLAGSGAGTFAAYRAQAEEAPPAIIVVIDNYAELANNYQDLADVFVRVAAEGSGLGIHLVLTMSATAYRLAPHIALAVALELVDATAYPELVGRTNGLVPAPGIAGRGLLKGAPPLEFQTALPVAGATSTERTKALQQLVSSMASAWDGRPAYKVRELPTLVALSELLSPGEPQSWVDGPGLAVPIALDAELLEPFELDLAQMPNALIAGPPSSGKTSLLQTWLLALAHRYSSENVKFYLVCMGEPTLLPLSKLPHTAAYVEDDVALSQAVEVLVRELDARRWAQDRARREGGGVGSKQKVAFTGPRFVIAIDDFDEFNARAGDLSKSALEMLLKYGRGLGFHVLLAGTTSALNSSYDSFSRAMMESKTGLLLGSTDHGELDVFRLRLPLNQMGQTFPAGRGYIVYRQAPPRLVQIATCQAGEPTLAAWVEAIVSRA